MRISIFLRQRQRKRALPSLLFLFSITAAVGIHAATNSQAPNPQGDNPGPEDASQAILAAFDKYEVIGISAAHGHKDLDDFILTLIRSPAFPSKVNDIAIECGNSLYQPILNRYIAGEEVPFAEVRKVWRNTSQTMCSTSGFYEELFPLVRGINEKLPPGKKLRVLAGDPPIDWSKVKSLKDLSSQAGNRDDSISSVMEKEVLSKHRKALMLFGTMHLLHKGHIYQSSVSIYEKDYPGVTFVIMPYEGFGNDTPLAKYNDQLEARISSWPVPSLASIKGTWLADLDMSYFFPPLISISTGQGCKIHNEYSKEEEKSFPTLVDAILYLGLRDTLLEEQTPADIISDANYMKELRRRITIMGPMGGDDDELSPKEIVASAENPFQYHQELYAMLQDYKNTLIKDCLKRQSGGSALAPKEHEEIQIDPKVFDAYVGRYQLAPNFILIVSRDGDRFITQATGQGQLEIFPESDHDFFAKAFDLQITFVTDSQGHATELILHQGGDKRVAPGLGKCCILGAAKLDIAPRVQP